MLKERAIHVCLASLLWQYPSIDNFFRSKGVFTHLRFLFVLASSLGCFFVYTWAKFVVALFLERGVTHFIRLFVNCVGGLSVGEICGRSFFRTSNIHTLHSLVICVRRLIVSRFCYVCGRLFLERVIFTHLFACLFVLNSSLASNLATRLGSSRSVNFFRGRCTLPEVHFRYPISRHDFRYDGR